MRRRHRWHVCRDKRKRSRRLRGKAGTVICLNRGCSAGWSPPDEPARLAAMLSRCDSQ